MKRALVLALLAAASVAAAAAPQRRGSTPLLNETFRSYPDGSDGSPRWLSVKGNWRIRDGAYEQTSAEYDCASMFGTYMESSFRIDAEFEHLAGDPGAGFIFASKDRENTRFAQMARFDGASTFLAGYFENGEFTGTVSGGTPAIGPHSRHTLSLIVDRGRGTFSVMLDGTPVWNKGQRARLVYAGGYIGLESSGGSVRYLRVTVTALNPAAASLDWVRRFTVAPDGRLIVPSERGGTVAVVDRGGATVATIGQPASRGGQIRNPSAVSILRDSLVAVTDAGAGCVHLFTLDGRWKRSAGWKGSGPGEFDGPVAVASSPAGQLFVLERTNHRVQVLDDTLGTAGQFGTAELVDPLDLAVEGNNVYVVNTGRGRVELYRWDGRKGSWLRSIPYGGGEGRGISVRGGRIYLSVVNQLRCYDTTGTLLASLDGRSVDFILPQGICATQKGVLFADWFGGRIVETTADLLDPTPAAATAEPGQSVVTWRSGETGSGVVTVAETGEHYAEESFGTGHRVALPAALTTRHVSVAPTLKTVPPRKEPSRTYPLPAPAPAGRMVYARLPMIALVFANVSDSAAASFAPAAQPELPDSEIARIRRQLAEAVRFYWVQSGMRLFLDLETLVIREPVRRRDLYGPEWWYPPKESVLTRYLRLNGKAIGDYSGILYMTCTQAYDTAARAWVLAGKGGAFTNGVGTGKGYGISWWDVTRANHNAGNNWLMVHEFNHQLDDIFMVSGYPEYWFNHISPTIGTAGPFGEHFDANRYILRIVPAAEWYDLRYTSFGEARDADGDGIPDNDPRLPLDEARLGSDSLKTDTDADGVPDQDELAFSNWITEGWGETAGRPQLPDLHSPDTDGDGVPDAADPLPCSPLRTEIAPGRTTLLGSIDDPRASGTLSCRRTSDTLEFEITMQRPMPVKIMLDLEHDGWFSGSDNVLVTAAPEPHGELRLQLFDGSSPSEWPHMNEELAGKIGRSVVWSHRGDSVACRITLTGLPPAGATVGVLAGILAPFDRAGNKRYIDFFEPNRFFPLTLKP